MAWERWTDVEWQKAQDLLKTHLVAEVAKILRRPDGSLRSKIQWEAMTPAERDARRVQINVRRKYKKASEVGKHKSPRTYTEIVSPGPKLTEAAIAERNRRWATMPRDLTAAFCGDPLPGYSALDQRA